MTAGRFDGEFGVQFVTHIADHYTTPEFGELGRVAYDSGFDQVWVNDRPRHRNVFTTLSAIASEAPIDLGTAILVPYRRNPLDLATTVASIGEMADSQEITLGIGRGGSEPRPVSRPYPYRMIRETTEFLRRLLAGEEVRFGDYELLTSYYGFRPDERMRLAFTPTNRIRFHIGGYGETAMTVAGTFMDGTVIGGSALQLLKTGNLAGILEEANTAAAEADRGTDLKHVIEINVSVSDDPQRAREFVKPYVAHSFRDSGSRLSDGDFESLGVDPRRVEQIRTAIRDGATTEQAADLVTDAMVESKFIVGTPEECLAQFEGVLDRILDLDVDQISFAKLGPDYRTSIELLGSEIIPRLS